jgi:DNA-binding transcriptional LysR family regulator
LQDNVPGENIVFRSGDVHAQRNAILAGAGIGFTSVLQAAEVPGLVQVMEPRPEWAAPLWLVTHMDLHRTTKVQAFLTYLKARAGVWQTG